MLIAIGVLVAVVALWPITRRVLGIMILRTAVRVVAIDISDQSLARVPDHIHLSRRTDQVWTDPAAAAAFSRPLLDHGFEDAGTFAVDEMPGVLCRLMVEPRDAIGAALYQHPKVGLWLELVSRYADGTSASFSTLKPTGMHPRPGHLTTHAPGTGALALLERMRTERPLKTLTAVSAATYPRTFEAGYAESVAWRKAKGVSAAEIVQVAQNHKAA